MVPQKKKSIHSAFKKSLSRCAMMFWRNYKCLAILIGLTLPLFSLGAANHIWVEAESAKHLLENPWFNNVTPSEHSGSGWVLSFI